MPKNTIRVGLLGLVLVVGLAIGTWVMIARPYHFHGSVIDPATPAPALSLPATDGSTFDLTQQRGKLVLVFFGYTSCADVCPGTLALLRQVVSQLGTQGPNVQVVFVTVDPQRDAMEKMRLYVNAFDPSFLGLTGTDEQLNPIWKAYGVYHQIQPNPDHPDLYTVDHSAFIYVIDRKSNLRLTYPLGTAVDDIVADLQAFLKEG